MVVYEKEIEAFFLKSTQLLEAFPTARVTTKYRKLNDTQSFITAKTYDPASGAIVKFKTDKTIDLGRLMVGSAKLNAKIVGRSTDEEENPQSDNHAVGDVEMTDVTAINKAQVAVVSDAQTGSNEPAVGSSGKNTSSSKKKKKKGKK